MVNLRELAQMNQSTRRMTKLITREGTGADPDVTAVCSATVDGMIQMQEELRTMLEALPNYEERMVFLLRFIKGYTVPQCAEAMNCSERAAFYFLKHGKVHLMERFPDRIALE